MPQEQPRPESNGRFLGHSVAARAVRRLIRLASANECTVLITGESGVGKELVARDIHELSPRASGPFVAVNCAAMPDTLVESELFGHESGAFTDARGKHLGAFERAHGGTLFLDEIGDLSLAAQPKLLRALDRREIVRVGGERERSVDVRFIAATNQDLAMMCQQRTFRSDLYYRLGVVEIMIPPLRDRLDDIEVLADHFAEGFATKVGRLGVKIPPESVRHLARFQWPGNVRQLRSAVERALIMCSDASILPEYFVLGSKDPGDTTLDQMLRSDWRGAHDAFERIYVERLLERHQGRVEPAAREAGLATGSLYKIIRRLGLRPGPPASEI